jgi:hypothetical protein
LFSLPANGIDLFCRHCRDASSLVQSITGATSLLFSQSFAISAGREYVASIVATLALSESVFRYLLFNGVEHILGAAFRRGMFKPLLLAFVLHAQEINAWRRTYFHSRLQYGTFI